MSRLSRATGKRIVAALSRAGFEVARTKGSHHLLQPPDGRRTVVPVHASEDVGPGLLLKILRQCEITREEFEKLL
jgi:predicted RNA binding protein YcfA (HicA-like mRNA interferase family)